MAKDPFPDALPLPFHRRMQAVAAARLFWRSPTLRQKATAAGQVAEYVAWQERVFGRRLDLYSRREKLWEQCLARLNPDRPLLVLEFGVAHGYATNWWLNRLGQDVIWHGFDRFTGLPRAWKDFGEGAFSNDGQPPEMNDPRVHWHVGDVEDTLKTVDLSAHREGKQWMVLFDLDLYEPTAFAWGVLEDYMRSGDVIYLDEAGDDDERKALDEVILPSIKCEPIAATPVGLGLVLR